MNEFTEEKLEEKLEEPVNNSLEDDFEIIPKDSPGHPRVRFLQDSEKINIEESRPKVPKVIRKKKKEKREEREKEEEITPEMMKEMSESILNPDKLDEISERLENNPELVKEAFEEMNGNRALRRKAHEFMDGNPELKNPKSLSVKRRMALKKHASKLMAVTEKAKKKGEIQIVKVGSDRKSRLFSIKPDALSEPPYSDMESKDFDEKYRVLYSCSKGGVNRRARRILSTEEEQIPAVGDIFIFSLDEEGDPAPITKQEADARFK